MFCSWNDAAGKSCVLLVLARFSNNRLFLGNALVGYLPPWITQHVNAARNHCFPKVLEMIPFESSTYTWLPSKTCGQGSGGKGLESLILPRFSKGCALESTTFRGASPTRGQGSVTVSGHRNTDFTCFPMLFDAFPITVRGFWKPPAGGVGPHARNTRNFYIFTFSRVPPTAPGACAICSMLTVKR